MRWVATVASQCHLTWHAVFTFMSRFGTKTPKPTVLVSNASWAFALARSTPGVTEPSKTATCTKSSCGRRVVTGNRDGTLKETQTSTREFGKAVQAAWQSDRQTYQSLQMVNPSDQWFDEPQDAVEAWTDLELDPLIDLSKQRLAQQMHEP